MKQNVFAQEITIFQNRDIKNAWKLGDELFSAALDQRYLDISVERLSVFVKTALSSLDEHDLVNLLPGMPMPRDACVGMIYQPSYAVIAVAIYLKNRLGEENTGWMNASLKKLMDAAFQYGIVGHGYEAGEMRRKTMMIFCLAGLKTYLEHGKRISEVFHQFMIGEIGKIRQAAEDKQYMYGDPCFDDDGMDKEPLLVEILGAYDGKTHLIFVYGTLMRGQHAAEMLKDAVYTGDAVLNGYSMYDLGNYPGIKPHEDGIVIGEAYLVDQETLKKLDRYEGEGSLYHRENVRINIWDVGSATALAYIYAHPVSGKPQEVRWGTKASDEIWYAAYGSNISRERFACYIQGGTCHQNGKHYTGCKNRELWKEDRPMLAGGRMYFGNASGSWDGGGVAFYLPDGQGLTHMHLYRITYGQLKDIQMQEGMSPNWYGKTVFVGIVEGRPVYTFTSETPRIQNKPSPAYLDLIRTALVRENGLQEDDAQEYLQGCMTERLLIPQDEQ